VAVALPVPIRKAFTYRAPPQLPLPERGARVLVPFGSRRMVGLVVGPGEAEAGIEIKDVAQVLDDVRSVSEPLLRLGEWMSEYYLAPLGECLRLLLPPGSQGASRMLVRIAEGVSKGDDPLLGALGRGPLAVSTLAERLGRDPRSRLKSLEKRGLVVLEHSLPTTGFRETLTATLVEGGGEPRGKAQAEVLRRLREHGGSGPVASIVGDRPSLRVPLRRLAELGLVRLDAERALRAPSVLDGGENLTQEPTAEQVEVLGPVTDAILARTFSPFLLHGVTGSGKTEVYFRACEAALALDRGVLLLVPEIALTPLLVRAAVARFGRTVSVLHSELSRGERHDEWWRILEGESRVVVGARSAVFAPVRNLGLIVVDEEHEAAYKQEEAPRYHGRDVAVMRARLEQAVVVLGSATPSLESQANAQKGRYRRLVMPSRIGARGLPRIGIVDRRAMLKAGGDPILSKELKDALGLRLARGEQALLLLNRRGWATSLVCRECGAEAGCPNCSVLLALHDGGRIALCHYCGHQEEAPRHCRACHGPYLKLTGFGTERVVDAVRAAVPGARVSRLDRDLSGRKGQLAKLLAAFEAGEVDVLVGTQMIAKGHDFPRVTLVGVIDADVGLGLPDFRSAERTFQLLTQVAGRAGRADLAGEVILQSHLPDHYAVTLACAQDYPAFCERELEFRRTMGYPPESSLLNLILRATDPRAGAEEAHGLGRRLRDFAHGKFRVLGPARAPLARLQGEHRFQILLKGRREDMRHAVRRVLDERYPGGRWPGVVVDVDPVSVM
jgi:primosomal protein N' (replication factor Y)